MAIKKASKEAPKIFTPSAEPNSLKIAPTKIGDIAIFGTSFYFAFGMAGTQWGTAGTGA